MILFTPSGVKPMVCVPVFIISIITKGIMLILSKGLLMYLNFLEIENGLLKTIIVKYRNRKEPAIPAFSKML